MDQSKLNKWSWRELQENMGEQVMIDGVICLLFWLDEKDREIFNWANYAASYIPH